MTKNLAPIVDSREKSTKKRVARPVWILKFRRFFTCLCVLVWNFVQLKGRSGIEPSDPLDFLKKFEGPRKFHLEKKRIPDPPRKSEKISNFS